MPMPEAPKPPPKRTVNFDQLGQPVTWVSSTPRIFLSKSPHFGFIPVETNLQQTSNKAVLYTSPDGPDIWGQTVRLRSPAPFSVDFVTSHAGPRAGVATLAIQPSGDESMSLFEFPTELRLILFKHILGQCEKQTAQDGVEMQHVYIQGHHVGGNRKVTSFSGRWIFRRQSIEQPGLPLHEDTFGDVVQHHNLMLLNHHVSQEILPDFYKHPRIFRSIHVMRRFVDAIGIANAARIRTVQVDSFEQRYGLNELRAALAKMTGLESITINLYHDCFRHFNNVNWDATLLKLCRAFYALLLRIAQQNIEPRGAIRFLGEFCQPLGQTGPGPGCPHCVHGIHLLVELQNRLMTETVADRLGLTFKLRLGQGDIILDKKENDAQA